MKKKSLLSLLLMAAFAPLAANAENEPTNVTVSNLTGSSAIISWTGTADSYDLRYRKKTEVPGDGFEDGTLGDWTTIDADGDGNTWYILQTDGIAGHDGSTALVTSASYNGSALNPDNYLVSPKVTLGGKIVFWANAQDASWAAEHFGVAVSTTVNDDPDAFEMVKEWDMTASRMNKGPRKEQGTWYQYEVDLSEFSGEGYVAIRHFDCSDWFRLNVDDIIILGPGEEMPETVEYKWTVVEDIKDTSYELTGLETDVKYEVEVRANLGNDEYSEWVGTWFTSTDTSVSLPYYEDFEGDLPVWDADSGVSLNSDESYAHSGSNFLAFKWTTTPPVYLFSPLLVGTEKNVKVSFWYRNYVTSYGNETFQVGYSTTTTNPDAFAWFEEVEAEGTDWLQYEVVVPAGVKYVSVKYTSYDVYYLFLDDFAFEETDEEAQEPALYLEFDELDDNQEQLAEYNGQTATIELTHTLYFNNVWNSICLPFDLTEEQIASSLFASELVALNSSSFEDGVLTLDFVEATSIEAGYPYLFRYNWDNTDGRYYFTFKNVIIDAQPHTIETDFVNFEGIFAPINLKADDRSVLFLGTDNKLYYPNADVTVNAFRGYFTLNGITAGDLAETVRMNFDGTTTGIKSLKTDKTNSWFTLDGLKLNVKPTQKGLYINNGKKVVVK